MKIILEALKFAEEKHRGQKRWGGAPYFIHPLNVTLIVTRIFLILDEMYTNSRELLPDDLRTDILTAAPIHDVPEDCRVSDAEIMDLFGVRVCNIVKVLTRSPDIEYKNYIINIINSGLPAMLIKKADLLHNSMDDAGKQKIHSKARTEKYENALQKIETEITSIFTGGIDEKG